MPSADELGCRCPASYKPNSDSTCLPLAGGGEGALPPELGDWLDVDPPPVAAEPPEDVSPPPVKGSNSSATWLGVAVEVR